MCLVIIYGVRITSHLSPPLPPPLIRFVRNYYKFKAFVRNVFKFKGLKSGTEGPNSKRFDPRLITIRELSMMLDVPSFVKNTVDFLLEKDLFEKAPPQATEGLESFKFTRQFEVIGDYHCLNTERGLWTRHSDLNACVRFRSRCWCIKGERTQFDAYVIGLENFASNVHGQSLRRKLIFHDKLTLDAFDSVALQALISFRWRAFGAAGYMLHVCHYLLYLVLNTFVARNRFTETNGRVSDLTMRILCVLIIVDSIWWLGEEIIEVIAPVYNVLLEHRLEREEDEKRKTRMDLWAATQSSGSGSSSDSSSEDATEESGEDATADAKVTAQCCPSCAKCCAGIPCATGWTALVKSIREYVTYPFNYVDVFSGLVSIIAMCMALNMAPGPSTLEFAIGPVMMSIANLLCWLRLFDLIRAVPGVGFYPHLLDEVFTDLIPFTLIILSVLTAFTISWQTVADRKVVNGGVEIDNPYSYFPSAFVRTWLMMLGDWDLAVMDSSVGWGWNAMPGAPEKKQPLASLILFLLFSFLVVVVMLNLLISILSETFERVTEASVRVSQRERLRVTMDIENKMRILTCCCRKKFDKWTLSGSNGGWYPRYLHVLRPAASDGSAQQGRGAVRLMKLKIQVGEVDSKVVKLTHEMGQENQSLQDTLDGRICAMSGQLVRKVQTMESDLTKLHKKVDVLLGASGGATLTSPRPGLLLAKAKLQAINAFATARIPAPAAAAAVASARPVVAVRSTNPSFALLEVLASTPSDASESVKAETTATALVLLDEVNSAGAASEGVDSRLMNLATDYAAEKGLHELMAVFAEQLLKV